MTKKVRIGHASTDTPTSGSYKDEVKIQNYYNMQPTMVLRPNVSLLPNLAENSAKACEDACNNDNIEYSQTYRNTLYNKAKETGYKLDEANIKTKCYADCSSFMTVCALAGGAELKFSAMPNCGTMKSVFTAGGYYTALTAKKYLDSSDYLQRGDILVRDVYLNGSRHTVMVLDNGDKVSPDPEVLKLQSDLAVLKLATEVTNIGETKIETVVKITKLENGEETLLTDDTIVKKYKWQYQLESLDSSTEKFIEDFKIASGKASIKLDNLAPNSSYRLVISAVELENSEFSFNAPAVIFTTACKAESNVTNYKFGENESVNKIDKTYIKIQDTFKRAIIYTNI